jgi:uroporphyrinogen-III decarboxylase
MENEITPKKLVRGVFEFADLPRFPFIPWVFTHAARLEQVTLRNMYDDPTRYSRCLQNTRKLYGYDAITGSFDPSLELEICGSPVGWQGDFETPVVRPDPDFNFSHLKDIDVESAGKTGRFGTVIESLRRINMVSGKNIALAAVVSGPVTVASGLTGRDLIRDFPKEPEQATRAVEAAAAFILRVVQVYCQLQLDIVAITERLMATCPNVLLSQLQSFMSPILNTIRFYNAFSVLLPGDITPDRLSDIIDLGFDAIAVHSMLMEDWKDIRGERPCVLGQAIPSRLLLSGGEELNDYLEDFFPEKGEKGVFLTTDWEVPPDTPPEYFHQVMNKISRD